MRSYKFLAGNNERLQTCAVNSCIRKQIAILLLGMMTSVLAQEDAFQERLIINDGSAESASKWSAAEATCTSDTKHSRTGGNAMYFHINVDWKTGEKMYPIGWPRITRQLPKDIQDWSGYDYLLFSIYVESSRTNLPATPLGMSLYLPDRPRTHHRQLSELQIGKWTDFKIPLQEIAGNHPCTGIQFHISESDYKDGDVLDFWIDQITLARYVKPFIAEASLIEQIIISDSKNLELEIAMFGINSKEPVEAECRILSGANTVFNGTLPVVQGKHRYSLPLTGRGLQPGRFDASVSYSGRTVRAGNLRVIVSPYPGGAK